MGFLDPKPATEVRVSALAGSIENRARLFTPTGAGSQSTALQAAINAAATAKTPLLVRGEFSIATSITIPSGADIDFSLAKITQTSNNTPVFTLTNVTGVTLRNLRAQGKTTDYANNSGVYQAAAVRLLGTTSDISIFGGKLLGFAGAGVYMGAAVSDVRIVGVRMTGAGSSYILDTTYNYSGGIVAESGATRWVADHNEISGFAQGIVTGDNMSDIRITHNYIHDIPGQHGLYLETINGGVISENVVRNCALLGMKIQIGVTTAFDADAVTISDNLFMGLGAQGILLTNPVGGTPRIRRVNVTDNVIRNALGHGISANNCVGVHIADNVMYDVNGGIDISASSGFELLDNRISKAREFGIRVDATDGIVAGNRIVDPASANTPSTEFGIHIYGTSSDITLRDNKVTDSLGNIRYGIYISAGDLTTMDIIGNRASGATDYGYRGLATNARSFRGNALSGTLGGILTPPSNFTAIASPTSDTVGGKVAIDAIRAVLIANGLIPS